MFKRCKDVIPPLKGVRGIFYAEEQDFSPTSNLFP